MRLQTGNKLRITEATKEFGYKNGPMYTFFTRKVGIPGRISIDLGKIENKKEDLYNALSEMNVRRTDHSPGGDVQSLELILNEDVFFKKEETNNYPAYAKIVIEQ